MSLNRLILSLLCAVGLSGRGGAQAPEPPPPPKPIPTLVLLLDTFRIVEAPCERVGEVYRVQVRDGTQDIPASQVLYAGESRADVQKFLASQSGRSKPSPRMNGPDALNSAAYPLFAAKVQPILTNLCARCHCAPASVGAFVLERVPHGYADPEATRRNARAAARVVDTKEPAASKLLTMAVTAHGDLRDPPVPSRGHPAFRNLEIWVHWAAAPEGSTVPLVIPAQGGKSEITRTAMLGEVKPETPPRPTAPDDPFSPDVFNRLRARTQ